MVLLGDMMREDVKPNCYTLPVVLKACSKMSAIVEGEQVHCLAVKNGFKSNTYVGTNLIELYSCVKLVGRAYRVFTEMVERNVVSWTAMINGYISNNDLSSAKQLFDLAPARDVVLWNHMVTAYAENGNLLEAKHLFDAMPNKDLMSYNTMLNGFANNGDIEGCVKMFDAIPEKNIFSWNGLINGYARTGRFIEVLNAFNRMLNDSDVRPNDATLVNVLMSCARLGALDYGKWVHIYAENNGYKENVYVSNGLIDMYAKCGLLEHAIDVFRSMHKKDLISWNTIINALALHGRGDDALTLFDEMRNAKEKPDGITFVGILSACSHMGLFKEGLNHFHSMTARYSLQPQIEHYGCVVDLLARGGLFEQALEVINNIMPMKADSVIWTSLLAASRVHKRIEFAELSRRKLIELDPKNPSNYVMLSNVYGEARKWGDVAQSKIAVRDTGLKKVPGISSIETGDGVAEFYSYDERHFRTGEIYGTLFGLTKLLRLKMIDTEVIEFGQEI